MSELTQIVNNPEENQINMEKESQPKTNEKFKIKKNTKYKYTDMEKYKNFIFEGIVTFDQNDFKCQMQILKNINKRDCELITLFLETKEGEKIELDDIANMESKDLIFCQNLLETLDPWNIFSNQNKNQKNGEVLRKTDPDIIKAIDQEESNKNGAALLKTLYS